MDKKVFFELIDRYLTGKASPEERTLVEAYYDRLAAMQGPEIPEEEMEIVKERMLGKIKEEMSKPDNERAIVRKLTPLRWIAAAASVVLLVGFGWYYLSNKPENLKPTEIAKTQHDVKPPASNRATITLGNGQVVYLDSAGNGTLAVQGDVNVVKNGDGQISYSALRQAPASTELSMTYNTLTNPKGSKVIDMTLSDGSRVWLNAGSSVTYPTAFAGKERKVSITGEAYFEVAHNAAMPFKVGKGDMEVTVLGTHFNVNAYDDEENIRVTLLEGSVRTSIVNSPLSIVLKPGEQSQVESGKLRVESGVDLEEVMSWKNGRFTFRDASIETIMRQIEKWYNVEVIYEGKVTEHFVSTIPRTVPVSEVFKILETTSKNWIVSYVKGILGICLVKLYDNLIAF